ncbi:hypothetical protein CK203_062936 [Vitis vinifera]|uniref:Uncharacterized protein n=1 Tax=Vitis vinifera TaxID=29760 RepID=A0A438G9J0_VITVI|nr:hypothetical protein CK203_062936 [Vitis vinifera]
MVLRSLQPRIARHVVGVPFTDFGYLVLALYDVEDGISKDLWTYSSPTDVKGKNHPEDRDQLMPRALHQTYYQTYMSPTLTLPYYAAQGTERLPISYFATGQPCYVAQFTDTKIVFTAGYVVEPGSSETHKEPRHEIDCCTALRHAIQDLIDQGLVHLGQPSVTTNPLPAYTTHAIPLSADGINYIDFVELDDHIYMLSWDESELEP